MADKWGFGVVQPVYVAELIPSKDFLGTEAEMFPGPELESKKIKDAETKDTMGRRCCQKISDLMCCCFNNKSKDIEDGKIEKVKEEAIPLTFHSGFSQDEAEPHSGFYQNEDDRASGCYRSWLEFEDIKDDVTYLVKISTVVNSRIIKSKLFEVDDVGWLKLS